MRRTWAALALAIGGWAAAASVGCAPPETGGGAAPDASPGRRLPTVDDGGSSVGFSGVPDDPNYLPPVQRSGAPILHRAAPSRCASAASASEPELDGGAEPLYTITCRSNAECAAQPGGRCVAFQCRGTQPSPSGGTGTTCTYDECDSDQDCPSDHVCRCGASSLDQCIAGGGANRCVPATCHTDGDCGPQGGLCSPSRRADCDRDIERYDCHTPADECSSDADCNPPGSSDRFIANVCRRFGSRWTCAWPQCEN